MSRGPSPVPAQCRNVTARRIATLPCCKIQGPTARAAHCTQHSSHPTPWSTTTKERTRKMAQGRRNKKASCKVSSGEISSGISRYPVGYWHVTISCGHSTRAAGQVPGCGRDLLEGHSFCNKSRRPEVSDYDPEAAKDLPGSASFLLKLPGQLLGKLLPRQRLGGLMGTQRPWPQQRISGVPP